MTGTVVALQSINGEIVEQPARLNRQQAKALDTKVRRASATLTNNMDKLADLLTKAAQGQIHVALGCASWTAWFADAVRIDWTGRVERTALVDQLSRQGMSQRAIAATLGVSQATVSREKPTDTDQSLGSVTGLNGKTYTRAKTKTQPVTDPEQTPLDVAEVEPIEPEADTEPEPETVEPEPDPPEAKPQPNIAKDFENELPELANTASAFKDIFQDDRFVRPRKRLHTQFGSEFQGYITDLQKLADILAGDDA